MGRGTSASTYPTVHFTSSPSCSGTVQVEQGAAGIDRWYGQRKGLHWRWRQRNLDPPAPALLHCSLLSRKLLSQCPSLSNGISVAMRIRERGCVTHKAQSLSQEQVLRWAGFPQGFRPSPAIMESEGVQVLLDYRAFPSAARALASSHIRFLEGPLGFGH